MLIEKNEENLAVLHDIKNLGVSIVLDDFGIGYSSMSYLQMFPFDKIKIDQIVHTEHDEPTPTAPRSCAPSPGSDGISTSKRRRKASRPRSNSLFLRTAGCQFAQGYLFSRPVPASKLTFERPDALRVDKSAA